jgi:dihydrofolate reductase
VIISIIAAMDDSGCIGQNNQLPWRLSADLQRFKALTMGHHILMGRKTYESIGRPLPGRKSIVITRQANYGAPGCQTSNSLDDALSKAIIAGESEAFIIGGAQIFTQALPVANRMYLTIIHAEYGCDVYFPPFETPSWKIVDYTKIADDPNFPHPYSFCTMIRDPNPLNA